MDAYTVSEMAGTSILMIKKYYGTLLEKHIIEAMAALAL